MKLSPKQITAWRLLQDRTKRKILFTGGARSGKSICVSTWITAVCETYPNCNIGVFRKYRKSCNQSVLRTFQDVLKGRGWELNKSELILTAPNGSQIAFYGTQDDNGEKLLGLALDLAWVNEITEITEGELQIILSRLSGVAVPVRKLIADCNPKNLSHWVRRYFILRVSEDNKPLDDSDSIDSLHFVPSDNPFLPADTIKTLKSLTGTAFKRLWEGLWADNSGLVFDEFDANSHIVPEIPDNLQYYCAGIDFGFTAPFCHLLAGVNKDGDVYIIGEHYKAGMLVCDHANAIKKLLGDRKPRWTVADSEDAESRAQLIKYGIPNVPTNKKEMGVLDGVLKIKEYLRIRENGKPRLYIVGKNCPNLVREIQNLTWKQGKDEYTGEDHAIDSLRYCIQKLQQPQYTGGGSVVRG